MLGTIVNFAAILAGGLIGLLVKKGLPERISKCVMVAIGLAQVCAGAKGYLQGQNAIIAILALALGTAFGALIDLDGRVNRLGAYLGARVGGGQGGSRMAEGMVTATLLFCVGAMAVLGSLQSGMTGDHTTLYTKSVIDGISAMLLSSMYGVGVLFAAVAVLVYQGAITLLAGLLAPVMTEAAVAEMTCVGSIALMGLGLNMIGVAKIKVMNMIPAIFVAILLAQLF